MHGRVTQMLELFCVALRVTDGTVQEGAAACHLVLTDQCRESLLEVPKRMTT